MDALFECTLEMVSTNLEDYPEHRTNFFRMLQSVTQHCFPGEGKGGRGRKGGQEGAKRGRRREWVGTY